ncbi:MAG: YfiR family protein [Desulfocapsaceae bacterium]|nr:YfiR family protein [Desulfocapsaceae bacterium]
MTITFPYIWWQRSVFCLIAAIILLIQPRLSIAQEQQVPEYHLKAVFLYNLVNFVAWPEERYEQEGAFEIAILGDDPFGSILDQTVAGEQWHGKPIRLERHTSLADLQDHRCDILFISSSAIDQWPDILTFLDNGPTLTVADSQNFIASGGMINLMQEENRIVLEINRKAASRAGLFVSSKLLRLARVVN